MSRFLGVDCGSRRVGLALSDGLGLTASPHSVVDRPDAVAAISSLAQEQDVVTIVVGLPTGLSGQESGSAADARSLAAELAATTGLEVVFHDERFTTRMADEALLQSGMKRRKRRDTVDKVAAAIILQDFLDSRR